MSNRSIESTLDTLVIALCLDYKRRALLIEKRESDRRTDVEYRYLNFKIFEAAAEIVGELHANIYIDEVGGRVGYAKSKINFVGEVQYKTNKRLIKDNIAKKLHLI